MGSQSLFIETAAEVREFLGRALLAEGALAAQPSIVYQDTSPSAGNVGERLCQNFVALGRRSQVKRPYLTALVCNAHANGGSGIRSRSRSGHRIGLSTLSMARIFSRVIFFRVVASGFARRFRVPLCRAEAPAWPQSELLEIEQF